LQVDDRPELIEDAPEAPQDEQMRFDIEGDAKALCAEIEALLFVCSEALSIKHIAKLCKVDEKNVAAALQHITEQYADRGVVVREIAGGYRFATSSRVREVVEAYMLPPKTHLSAPALETLAIVAYMQPVTKSEIEAVRGVSADSVVTTLLERQFLTEAGRKDVVGRPILYKTTPEFLESFGLRSLTELPALPADVPLQMPLVIAEVEKNEEPADLQPESADTENDTSDASREQDG